MEKWYVAAKKADFNEWAEEFHISPVVARVLRNRDLTEKDQVRRFLYGKLEDCYSPWRLKDMDRAVEQILAAIDEGIRIRVIGDYDVDGVCASYILTKGLGILGAKVDTAIPHRIHDGYGLNDNLIEIARQDGTGMIVTCDNGIAAAPQIALANSYGIRVIVTDHHEVPFVTEQDGVRREQLPPALAVIDPKQEQCRYPFPGICGGTVAYKLIAALAEKTGDGNLREAMEELLRVHPGSASVLSLLFDRDRRVQLVMDRETQEAAFFSCHPCESTGTLKLHTRDVLEVFLPRTGHQPVTVELPWE